MSSGIKAVQLLSIDFNSGHFTPQPQALALLSAINGKVRVLSTVGNYRTGKSYLLNRLAGQQHGFPLGHAQEGKTNGFWLMNLGVSTVAGEEVTTLLLDTQGMNDVRFANSARTSGLVFLAAALLSSCLLLNQLGVVGNDAVDILAYAGTAAQNLVLTSADNKAAQADDYDPDVGGYHRYMPPVIMVLRDQFLAVPEGYSDVTDYIQRGILQLKTGGKSSVKAFNDKVHTVRTYFKTISGFCIPHPMSDMKAMTNVEDVPYEQLKQDFRESMQALNARVLAEAPVKKMPGFKEADWIPMTGAGLSDMVQHLCTAFNEGKAACVEDIWTATSLRGCTQGIAEGIAMFKQELNKLVIADDKAPSVETQELLETKAVGLKAAHKAFYRFAVGPLAVDKKAELERECDALHTSAVSANSLKSSRQCDAEIDKSFAHLVAEEKKLLDFLAWEVLSSNEKAECMRRCKGPSRADVEGKLQARLATLEGAVRMRFQLDEKQREMRDQQLRHEQEYAEQNKKLQAITEQAEKERLAIQADLEANRAMLEAQTKRVDEAEADNKKQQVAHAAEIKRLEADGHARLADLKKRMSQEFDEQLNTQREENRRNLQAQQQVIASLQNDMKAQQAENEKNLKKIQEENEASVKRMKEEHAEQAKAQRSAPVRAVGPCCCRIGILPTHFGLVHVRDASNCPAHGI